MRLEKEGIIQARQFADWAAPIVPVVKSNDSVRICGDYKVTANIAMKVDTHPILRIEELMLFPEWNVHTAHEPIPGYYFSAE